LVRGFPARNASTDSGNHGRQVGALAGERRFAAYRTVTGDYLRWFECGQFVERAHPIFGVGVDIGDIVSRPLIHAEVASEQDAFFRKPGDRISHRVPGTNFDQFHAVRAIVENEFVRKANLRMFELLILVVRVNRGPLPGSGILSPGFGEAIGRTKNGRAGIDEDSVSVCVIAVIMRVEHVLDGLVGGCADVVENRARAPWIVGVDDENSVAKHDPAGIRDDALVGFGSTPVHIWSELVRLAGLARPLAREREQKHDDESPIDCGASHRASEYHA